ncbi:MAG: hypothetical protein Q7Q71_13390 [Verrucomicrobiota bacterium JB023]|nr:hypothetical protein [Verrucomicrobiota bacterium JB023]
MCFLASIAIANAEPNIRFPQNASWIEKATSIFLPGSEESDLDDYILHQRNTCFDAKYRIEIIGGSKKQTVITFDGEKGFVRKGNEVIKGEKLAKIIEATKPKFLLQKIQDSLANAKYDKTEFCMGNLCDLYRIGGESGSQISFWVDKDTKLVEHMITNGSDGQIVVVDFEWIDPELIAEPENLLNKG